MTTTSSPTPVRVLLRGRFGWFFAGRTIDLFGSSMTTVALSLAVLQTSGNATDLGIVLAANMLPMLVLLLAGGVLADRFSRRLLLIAANLVSGAAIAAVAVILLTGRYHLGTVAALSLLTGAVGAFAAPALRGIVPELVADDDLQRANALLSGSGHAVRIIAPTVAALLTATAGGGWALAVDACTYLVAALLFRRLPAGSRTPAATRALPDGLAAGWRVFRSLRWVVLTSLSFAVINAVNVGPWNILGPLLVTDHDGALGWGAVLSIRAAGLLLMSVLAVRLVLRRPLRTGRLLGVLPALPLLALGLSGDMWIVAVAAFVGGLGFTVSAITWDTALQSRVPREALSRVSAFDDLFSYAAIPLSQLAAGPLAAAIGAHRLALLCGLVYAVAALAPLASREVRRA
ncbi:MFS transporter [Actinoplanes sp. NEAU-A12]|uniref:MFS transporter n=1 Tax=Actinoplanes sandaracinus TaxID=3045177 RepID=A0ABT6WVH3_9ACTN|nr:MFS transporter [Actinoplanes sandaracinus]MDI6103747.1 MFS transporter [Actinoplanes sandaracinus]